MRELGSVYSSAPVLLSKNHTTGIFWIPFLVPYINDGLAFSHSELCFFLDVTNMMYKSYNRTILFTLVEFI